MPITHKTRFFTSDMVNAPLMTPDAGGIIAQTQSDSAGDWRFENLNPEKKYTVIGYDDSTTYAPVIGGGLTCD